MVTVGIDQVPPRHEPPVKSPSGSARAARISVTGRANGRTSSLRMLVKKRLVQQRMIAVRLARWSKKRKSGSFRKLPARPAT
jgi:hypothetical protein